jgi:hypothetical protein
VESYGKGDARKLLRMIAERNVVSGSCEASIDGDSFTWNFEALGDLSLGDESQSWVMFSEGFPGRSEFVLYVSWIRQEAYVARIVYSPRGFRLPGSGGPEEFELKQFEELARIVDAKLGVLED